MANTLLINPSELNLLHTLTPGQAFRWRMDSGGRWTGVVRGRIIRIWQEETEVKYEIFPNAGDKDLLCHYFRLEVCLACLYADFIREDERLKKIIKRFEGLRVLRQEPEETLFSYICSTANSISRIVSAIEAISNRYGERIANLDGVDYCSFPSAEAIAHADPNELAEIAGLGFRAANLHSVARQILDRPNGWLNSLKEASYEEARRELLALRGVGLKIADCILLFSLDKDQAFPVDTHIYNVAVKYYMPELRGKSLTPRIYQRIVDYFQAKFGAFAGWAQEYLYYDDLIPERPQK
ncbi:MAG: 8-oxoguanine DNA glycosylase [Armatimonadetes bacterium]|nr:8-oxoguanine DNA glycosylase [Armatimonadota bacterium]